MKGSGMSNASPASMNPDELLRILLEQATEHALVVLDAEGRIVHWLAGAETIFGYAASEVSNFMKNVFGGKWIPHVDIIPHIDHVDIRKY